MPWEDIECADVSAFVSALRADHAALLSPRDAIYRGHADAGWKLIPKALRPGTRFPRPAGWLTVDEIPLFEMVPERQEASTKEKQLFAEVETLVQFFDAADEAGLPLPEDGQAIRDRLSAVERPYLTTDWPASALRSILALAQHHGLPTRLLDWTWDWRVAAFFAARDHFDTNPRPDHPAVWSLESSVWSLSPAESGDREEQEHFRLDLVTAPGAMNANLRGQRGVFTLLTTREPLAEDAALEGVLAGSDELCKWRLPGASAGPLLRALAFEGVTAAALFPGFDGIVRSMKDRPLWDEE